MGPAALLRLLTACGGVDSGAPPEPVAASVDALDPLRPYAPITLVGAVNPSRVRSDPRSGLSFVVDPTVGVFVIEELATHDGAAVCAPAVALGVTGPQGGCASGEIELQRGFLPGPVVDVMVDPANATAWLVSEDGAARRVPLDPVAAGPEAWRRPEDPVSVGVSGVRGAVWTGGAMWFATDDAVVEVVDGVERARVAADHPELFVVDREGPPGFLDGSGWWAPGASAAVPAAVVGAGAGGVAIWADGGLTLPSGELRSWPERPVGLAVGRGGVVYALGAGLDRVDAAGATHDDAAGAVVAVTDTHDVFVVAGGRVEVRYDERALISDYPALWVSNLTTLENPKDLASPIVCSGSDGIPSRLERAGRMRSVLQALPGADAWGLAVSARFAEGVAACEAEPLFEPWRDGAFDLGFMLHEPSDCGGDGCFTRLASERHQQLSKIGVHPTWATAAHATSLDWVGAVRAQGISRYLLFGAAVRPDVDQDGLIAKEGYPVLPGDGSFAFRVASNEGVPPPLPWLPALIGGCASEPFMTFYPGRNRAALSQDGCDGLLYAECILLQRNSGYASAADAQALALAARHAAARRGLGVTTWSWHLADLGTWDYSAGCTFDAAGRPTGCEAATISQVLDDLAYLADAGVVRFAPPRALPLP